MTLLTEAEKAEDIGDAFTTFRLAVPEFAPDLAALVAELYLIGAALRKIDAARFSAEYGPNYLLIQDDLDFARSELTYTLDDVWRIIGEIGRGKELTRDSYRQTWKDICIFFRMKGRPSLFRRLQMYKRFIDELESIIRRRPYEIGLIGDLRGTIRELHSSQDQQLTDAIGGLSLEPIALMNKPRSWERPRPPTSPPDTRDDALPSAPDVPTSSAGTFSTSQISSLEPEVQHWATRVFRDMSSTPLPRTGDISSCYGESTPDARDRLEEYDELLEIEFGGGRDLTVRLYVREYDHRARILCKSPGKYGSTYCSLPLNTLFFDRVDSSLHLCRRRSGSSKPELWAALKFTTIERLVSFFCTLIALRSYDNGRPIENIRDFELKGEVEIFGGKIVDDYFLHGLRVYIDKDSKAIRLQASILRGEMKNTPVWTAFITHFIGSRTWCSPAGSKLIYLGELRRHIFSSQYTPHTTARGEHVLKFTTQDDAVGFLRTIDDLAQKVCRRR